MSRRNKLQKFAEIYTFPNVYENFDPNHLALTGQNGSLINLKGQWNELHFKNNNKITLELACGGGEYAVALGAQYPNRNFIGVDIKGARIWKGARTALAQGLQNVAFLRTRIEHIAHFFAPEEISEIWITFPDPFLRDSKSNRRLTSPPFLNIYRAFLKHGGIFHLKTDEPNLYTFTLNVITQEPDFQLLYHDDDIYAKPLPTPELDVKTHYEMIHLADGKTIKYVQFAFKPIIFDTTTRFAKNDV